MADIAAKITILFATSGWASEVTAVASLPFERQVHDVSHLGQDSKEYRKKLPGSLIDAGGLTVTAFLDPDDIPPIDGDPETITLTFPLPAGQATPATLEGTGFVSAYSFSTELDAPMTVELTITWDGATGPTYTPSSAV